LGITRLAVAARGCCVGPRDHTNLVRRRSDVLATLWGKEGIPDDGDSNSGFRWPARMWHAQGTITARLVARSRHGGLCSVVAAVRELT
jgi:hypothetical protein